MIFLDSSFLVAFQVEGDSNHGVAVKIMYDIVRGKYGRPIVSDYIFSETVTVILARTRSARKAAQAGEAIRRSYEIRKADASLFEGAWALFKKQTTTKFSFVDCTTLCTLLETDVKNLATFDKEFRKIKNINVVPDQ